MNNTPWSADELDAAAALQWPDFHEKYPHRSRHAWRVKRYDIARGWVPTEKVAPVTEGMVEDEHARQLLQLETDERLFDALISWQAELNRAFPFRQDVRVRIDTDEPIGLCFPSDWHIGSEGTDLPRLRADVKLISSHPRLYCGLGGDVIDNFILEKMAGAARSQAATVQVQWHAFRYLMQYLLESHSLLWVSSGNHDQWTERASGIDGILSALGSIPVAYIGEGGYVDVTVGAQTYVVWRKHRPGRFGSVFNKGHFLKQMMRVELPREFDIGISEHIHDPETATWTYRGKRRALCATGAYKIKDRFAESLGYYSGGYGVPCVVVWPNERRLVPFDSIRDALELLDGPSRVAPRRKVSA